MSDVSNSEKEASDTSDKELEESDDNQSLQDEYSNGEVTARTDPEGNNAACIFLIPLLPVLTTQISILRGKWEEGICMCVCINHAPGLYKARAGPTGP